MLLTDNTDIITIFLNSASAFPEMQYEPTIKMETRKDYGEEYCNTVFKIKPEIKNVRLVNKQ